MFARLDHNVLSVRTTYMSVLYAPLWLRKCYQSVVHCTDVVPESAWFQGIAIYIREQCNLINSG